ncbi:hypothetical protein ECANGB1_1341 [Enterospora canceri]|uniref:Uncharacterized protein n=1 Tax=Enterospora canceri TaxID=1081671 RepID=A0A1Y1S6Z4_9MICR|nr:hypothetical protein ECANGB1_1341 [Enterospora canceri]
MPVDESKNLAFNDQVASISVNKRMAYEDYIDMDALDCRISYKVQEMLNEIENELIMESTHVLYNEHGNKKTRAYLHAFRSLEMKTNCFQNAEEDLFEIDGVKDAIIEQMMEFETNDALVVSIKRKKIKDRFIGMDKDSVFIESLDGKTLEYTYRQIDEDGIKFEKEI